jgi:hypothetical protein
MRKCIALFSGMAMAAVSAFALSGTCVQGTYTSYLTPGSCTDGDATFSNFSSLAFSSSLGAPSITTDNILVTPGGTTLNPTLTFTYVDANLNPAPITVNGQQIFGFNFTYVMVLTGANLTNEEMDTRLSNSGGGNVAATKNAQLTTGGTIFSSGATDGGISNPANTLVHGPNTAVTGTGNWNIKDTISLQAAGGTATQNSFENLFTLTPAVTTGTPEPMTGLLIGSGLLGVGLISRRKRHAANN